MCVYGCMSVIVTSLNTVTDGLSTLLSIKTKHHISRDLEQALHISEQVLLGAQLKKHITLTSDVLLTVSNALLQITKQSSFLRRLAMPQQ